MPIKSSDQVKIGHLRKAVLDVLPANHNINVEVFVERLYLRGARIDLVESN